jgi:Phytanoyl-CoA dioxygenase (PhyH)
MRVPDSALDEVRQRGFSLVEGFLDPSELAAAQEALWLHFPRPQDYFAAEGPQEQGAFSRFGASQFAGIEEFPYRSWDLNGLAVHPDLVDMAERYLETRELHLYKVELWAKYSGAVDYDQPLHRDYGSHSLVVPRLEPRYEQVTTFVYLSDVNDEDAPTCIVPYDDGCDIPYTPLYLPFGSLAEAEVRCTGPAGSLLVYRTDILHRGSNFLAPGRSRFSLLADFQVRGTTWGGKMAWPKQSPDRWAKFIPRCSVRQRDLFGFPRPGDPYWDAATLDGVAARYPGIDLDPYRKPSAGA